jgi:hypothetical protein
VAPSGEREGGGPGVDFLLRQAAHSLRTDRATAQVVSALCHAEVPSLLLKGPAIARALYPAGGRSYEDCDLLVPESALAEAGDALRRAGFEPTIEPGDDLVAEWQRHSQTWVRADDRVCVELHWRLTHVGASPQQAWQTLSRDAGATTVCGVEVPTPAPPQLAAIVVLHVASHGGEWRQPLEDLKLALARFDRAVWTEATAVARELEAEGAFAAGLRRVAEGDRLAGELGLGKELPLRVALTADDVPPRGRLGATLIDELRRAPGLAAKMRLIGRAAFPSPAYMRLNRKPLARFGPVGLAAAYAIRPFDLARKAPAAWSAWRRARRRAGDGS